MRKHYLKKLKKVFCKNIIMTRTALGLTLEQMANKLSMDPRSYIDIDHGKNSCSALTLILYLIYCCPDVKAFLSEVKEEFEKDSEDSVA